jgi:hypothetical protein
MRLKTLFALFENHQKKTDDGCGVFPVERFRQVLERERYRSDRNHHGFSLLTFKSKYTSGEQTLMSEVMPVLLRRARSSDIIGWLDDGSLAVLLPETVMEGASKLMGDIYHMAPELTACSECQIYYYPSNWPWGENRVFEGTAVPPYDAIGTRESMEAGKADSAH